MGVATSQSIDYPKFKLHRFTDPATSIESAAGDRRTHRIRILQVLAKTRRVGLNVDEVAYEARLAQHETGKRISDLLNLGLVEVSRDERGIERTAVLLSGRRGRIYRITDAGRLVAKEMK